MAVVVSRANHRTSKRSKAARYTYVAVTRARRIGASAFDAIQLGLERAMLRGRTPYSPYAPEFTEADEQLLREIEKDDLPVWQPRHHR